MFELNTWSVVAIGIGITVILYFIIRFLQKKGILHEVGSDTSAGGV
jgi:phosphotransferase system  glucose/maltose/N-acetylglucosamine-specific IIC component